MSLRVMMLVVVDLFVEDEGSQMREEEEERDCFCFVWHPLRLILRLGLRRIQHHASALFNGLSV